MAEGREYAPRSSRWVNGLIWSSGLVCAACFVWRVLLCDENGTSVPVGLNLLVPRLLGAAILPVLLFITCVGRGAKQLGSYMLRHPTRPPADKNNLTAA